MPIQKVNLNEAIHVQVLKTIEDRRKLIKAELEELDVVQNYHEKALILLKYTDNGLSVELCVEALTELETATAGEILDWILKNHQLPLTYIRENIKKVYGILENTSDKFAHYWESPAKPNVWQLRPLLGLKPICISPPRFDEVQSSYIPPKEWTDTPSMPSTTENQDGSDIHTDQSERT